MLVLNKAKPDQQKKPKRRMSPQRTEVLHDECQAWGDALAKRPGASVPNRSSTSEATAATSEACGRNPLYLQCEDWNRECRHAHTFSDFLAVLPVRENHCLNESESGAAAGSDRSLTDAE